MAEKKHSTFAVLEVLDVFLIAAIRGIQYVLVPVEHDEHPVPLLIERFIERDDRIILSEDEFLIESVLCHQLH